MEALASMQDTLLEHGVIKKRLPVEEHIAREFAPVKIGYARGRGRSAHCCSLAPGASPTPSSSSPASPTPRS